MSKKGNNINRFHKHQRASRSSWRGDKRTAHERGYTPRWQRAAKRYLDAHPLCVMCKADGVVCAATVVDHITPHEGNDELFWCVDNWQPLCKTHHDSDKQQIDNKGYSRAIGADGWPLDSQHPVYLVSKKPIKSTT